MLKEKVFLTMAARAADTHLPWDQRRQSRSPVEIHLLRRQNHRPWLPSQKNQMFPWKNFNKLQFNLKEMMPWMAGHKLAQRSLP